MCTLWVFWVLGVLSNRLGEAVETWGGSRGELPPPPVHVERASVGSLEQEVKSYLRKVRKKINLKNSLIQNRERLC